MILSYCGLRLTIWRLFKLFRVTLNRLCQVTEPKYSKLDHLAWQWISQHNDLFKTWLCHFRHWTISVNTWPLVFLLIQFNTATQFLKCHSPKATCPFVFYINLLKWDKPFSKRQSDHAFWFITNYLFCLYFWRWRPSVQITLSTWLTMLNYPKKLNSYVHKEDWSICDFLSPSAGRKKTKKYMRPSSR